MKLTQTTNALDYSLAAILRIPGRLAEKGTGSRVLISAGALVAAYVTATQSGLEGGALIAATLAPIIGGGAYVTSQTQAKKVQAQAEVEVKKKMAEEVAKTMAPETAPDYTPAETISSSGAYHEPFEPKDYPKNTDPFLAWEEFENLLSPNWFSFHDYTPAVRMPLAKAVIDEAENRLDAAWEYQLEKEEFGLEVVYPKPENLNGYRARAEFDAMLRDNIPGCRYVSEQLDMLLKGYADVYRIQRYIEAIGDREVDWTKVNSLYELGHKGLSVIKN